MGARASSAPHPCRPCNWAAGLRTLRARQPGPEAPLRLRVWPHITAEPKAPLDDLQSSQRVLPWPPEPMTAGVRCPPPPTPFSLHSKSCHTQGNPVCTPPSTTRPRTFLLSPAGQCGGALPPARCVVLGKSQAPLVQLPLWSLSTGTGEIPRGPYRAPGWARGFLREGTGTGVRWPWAPPSAL